MVLKMVAIAVAQARRQLLRDIAPLLAAASVWSWPQEPRRRWGSDGCFSLRALAEPLAGHQTRKPR